MKKGGRPFPIFLAVLIMNSIVEEINQLKKEKNAIIMAHYYVPDEVQAIADYIGDSFYLSKIATKIKEDTIVFCGVSFMGESAKILNPSKTVLLPDSSADCPMAHMADITTIQRIKSEYEDVAVVCYINSTAELKSHSDVCVTSSNAISIIKALPNKNIFFIPDQNLAHYVAAQVPEKHFIFNDGYCPIHKDITVNDVIAAKHLHPNAEFLVHPECPPDVLAHADMIGSTSEIIDYASKSTTTEFIIGTEAGVLYELKQNNPDKTFYTVTNHQCCTDMKKITLEKIRDVLLSYNGNVEVSDELRHAAHLPLNRMLELAK